MHNTLVDSRLALPVGHPEDRGAVTLDLAAAAHTLVIGACGTGKTVMLRRLAASALERGFEVVIIDAVMRGLNFRAFADRATVARDGKDAVSVLEDLVAELARRKDLLRTHEASTLWDLPDSEDLRPIMVVIDEYAGTVVHRQLPRGCDRDEPWYIEGQQRNSQAETIKYLTEKILREGCYAGIHVVLGTQRPDHTVLSRESLDHIRNVIVAVRPGMGISQTMVAMVVRGGMAAEMAVNDAVNKAAAAETRGHAVLVTEGIVQQFRFPAEA